MYKILISDPLHALGVEALRASGAQVDLLAEGDRARLPEMLPEYDALVVRSGTKVTAELLAAGENLKVVGRAGVGVDNVDIARATELGILVVNAPTANLISACEHTFALLLGLMRQVPNADRSMKAGEWNRKAFVGQELQHKTLGIVGFGRIGQQVARRARAFDMEVVAFDPFLDPVVAAKQDVELLPLPEVLATADAVTIHVPLSDDTRGLIGRDELRTMQAGSVLVNCARGGIVDEEALREALDDGHLHGAALDVFATEPPTDWTLAGHERVLATPHIGAQTQEAQERIALQTAKMVLEALDGSLAVSAVNLPFRPAGRSGEPFLRLGERLGLLASALVKGGAKRLEVDLWGVDEGLRIPITVAVTRGILLPYLDEAVNYVNAEQVAASRGIEVVRSTHPDSADYPHLVGVRLTGTGGSVQLAGTFVGDEETRVVEFNGFRLEFRPKGRLLVLANRDVPGVVGRLGTILGEGGVNIAEIHLARTRGGGDAAAVLRLDQAPSEATLATITALDEVTSAQVVDLT